MVRSCVFTAVDHIVAGHGVNGQHRRSEVDFNPCVVLLLFPALSVSAAVMVHPGGQALTSAVGTPTPTCRRHPWSRCNLCY